MPIIPVVSQRARDIYQRGLQKGNNPRAFAKVGDCQNISAYFLGVFDRKGEYALGPYQNLQEVIDQFAGSFDRSSMSVRGGFNAASVLSPFWADPTQCKRGESPMACEFRLQNPSIVIISLEEWWSRMPAQDYEGYVRQIIEASIERGAVPILATKADNYEGDNSINITIAKLAYEYDIPLWNFWRAVQPLPNKGLYEDGFHLTLGPNFFDDPKNLQAAWPMRNFTALQSLDAVWRGVK